MSWNHRVQEDCLFFNLPGEDGRYCDEREKEGDCPYSCPRYTDAEIEEEEEEENVKHS